MTNTLIDDLSNLPEPIHPGVAMKALLMRQRDLSFDRISAKSGLPVRLLEDFAAGQAEMTRSMRSRLSGVFGEAAATLYRMQLTYDYFQEHGRRPPARRLGL